MKRLARIAAPLSLVLAASCAGEDPTVLQRPQRGQASLRAIADCPDLEASLKAQLRDRSDATLAGYRDNALETKRRMVETGCCDASGGCYYGWGGEDMAGGTANYPAPPSPSANEGGASEYSTTNTQVAGVDEADLVKNDGSHIFLAAGSELLVFDAWPAAETHLIASVALEGAPQKLFLAGDRVVVYSSAASAPACGGYDAAYVAPGADLVISVLDISDRSAPKLERVLELSGGLVAARRIGDEVHTVVAFPRDLQTGLNLQYWPELDYCEDSEAEIQAAFRELAAENRAQIAALEITDLVPSVRNLDYVNGHAFETSDLFADCEGFYEPSTLAADGYLSVLTFPLDADRELSASTILGHQGIVYASTEALYVALQDYDAYSYYGAEGNAPLEHTDLHKFRFERRGTSYSGSGSVPGHLVNQFAMDEHRGFLRAATTIGHAWDPNASSGVYVLGEQLEPSSHLAIVGSVAGLAPTEDIRSVRFDGDKGFIVTFKKTDPLFALDLSAPASPKVLGELKIPGFSTYMHLMDDSHLLSIGFDAADQGSFAWFTSIILQIFDVSDLTEPKLVHKEVIGSRGTTSDATNDHLAFNYFPSRQLLALPMGICEGGNQNGGYGSTMTFNGLLVYHVTAQDGFSLLGGVDHQAMGESAPPGSYNSGCYNWWENPNSQVKRSVFLEDYVFSISTSRMLVNAVSDLDTPLSSFELPAAESTQSYACW